MPSLIETTPEVTTDADLIPDLNATANEESKQYQETKEELMQPLGPKPETIQTLFPMTL